jgi:hypothetical protein
MKGWDWWLKVGDGGPVHYRVVGAAWYLLHRADDAANGPFDGRLPCELLDSSQLLNRKTGLYLRKRFQ